MYPDVEYMSAVGDIDVAREWSVLDVLRVSGNASCGVAIGNWPAVATSTSERYFNAFVAPESLLSQPIEPLRENWNAYEEWTLGLVLPTTDSSGTRA